MFNFTLATGPTYIRSACTVLVYARGCVAPNIPITEVFLARTAGVGSGSKYFVGSSYLSLYISFRERFHIESYLCVVRLQVIITTAVDKRICNNP